MLVCKAVRRGVKRAVVGADLPAHEQNVEAALRLQECGAQMVKILGSADLVRSVVRAGVPVFAEFHGGKDNTAMLVDHAKRLEDAGASLLDFRHSGPLARGGGARGRHPGARRPRRRPVARRPHAPGARRDRYIDSPVEQYANVAKIARDALSAYAEDVRRPPDQGPACLARSSASPPGTRCSGTDRRSSCTRPAGSTRRSRSGASRASTSAFGCSSTCRRSSAASRSTGANAASRAGVEPVAWRDYAAHGKALLEHLGIGAAHVIGGCMGCSCALAFAVAYPASTRSLLLWWPVGGAKYRIRAHQRFSGISPLSSATDSRK